MHPLKRLSRPRLNKTGPMGVYSMTHATEDNRVGKSVGHRVRSLFGRAVWAVALTAIVVVSLLSYPSVVPWMVGFWMLWHTIAVTRRRPGWVPLVTCAAVLVAKRVYWAPTLVSFVGVALLVAIWRASLASKEMPISRWDWMPTLCLWGVWIFMALQWQAISRCNHAVNMDPVRPVVCIGDSLTSGLLPDRGYPEELKRLIRPSVVNLGQSGITTEHGLDRLPQIAEANPQVVVIELGGHDFLQGKSRASTKKNLERLIVACREMDAEVVLMEIPRGFMTDPFAGLEREIALEYDVELVSDSAIRQLVLWSPISPPGMWMPGSHLSDDGIHTNSRGNVVVARHVADALARMCGEQILRHSLTADRNQYDGLPSPSMAVPNRAGRPVHEPWARCDPAGERDFRHRPGRVPNPGCRPAGDRACL